jgi:hypothetical protein
MFAKGIFLAWIIILFPLFISGQETKDSTSLAGKERGRIIYGFIRGVSYGDLKNKTGKAFVSSAFSDLALKIESSDRSSYKAFADIRFRYGSEFHKAVNTINIKEAFVKYTGRKWEISAGQEILKWGRADFTNPTSKLNPENYISRSPDREDMDMGNLLSYIKWYPSEFINVQAVVAPFYRSSVLLIDPIPLPDNVSINKSGSLVTDKEMISYGLKTDFHFRGIDLSASWFEGYDPIPGASLLSFSINMSNPLPVTNTIIQMTPYKTRMIGFDFESSIGIVGLRGEAAWSVPVLSYKVYEYIPLPEVKWVAGMDLSMGIWRITGEYSGKIITDFTPALVAPVLAAETDYSGLADLLSIPGFDIENYVRQQVGAFNRLYNYQLKKSYHSAGVKIENELLFGKVLPSVFTMYNFTSHDLLIIPEIKLKPSDGLAITAGVEFYSGKKGSLFDLIDGFMSSVYVGLKVDF